MGIAETLLSIAETKKSNLQKEIALIEMKIYLIE